MKKPVIFLFRSKYIKMVFLCALVAMEINIGIILVSRYNSNTFTTELDSMVAIVQEATDPLAIASERVNDIKVYLGNPAAYTSESDQAIISSENDTGTGKNSSAKENPAAVGIETEKNPPNGSMTQGHMNTNGNYQVKKAGQFTSDMGDIKAGLNMSQGVEAGPDAVLSRPSDVNASQSSPSNANTRHSAPSDMSTSQSMPSDVNASQGTPAVESLPASPESASTLEDEEDASQISEQNSGDASQKIPYPIQWGDGSKPSLSITFDDGYNTRAIITVLDLLKKYNIKSTFFIVGEALRNNPKLWKRAYEEGHQICNHTEEHKSLSKLSLEQAKKQILDWEKTATAILGEDYVATMKKNFPYFRLPGGNGSNNKELLAMIRDLGYTVIGWSDETCYAVLRHYDLKKADVNVVAREIVRHITGNAKNGSIILLHFNPYDTAKLEDIITGILDKGFEILPVTEVISILPNNGKAFSTR